MESIIIKYIIGMSHGKKRKNLNEILSNLKYFFKILKESSFQKKLNEKC